MKPVRSSAHRYSHWEPTEKVPDHTGNAVLATTSCLMPAVARQVFNDAVP